MRRRVVDTELSSKKNNNCGMQNLLLVHSSCSASP
jgi:hypothetical protein